jgi:hypothetical protein
MSAEYYDAFVWESLPADVQQAATDLGYTERSWDNDYDVSTTMMFWSELTVVQQAAAGVLLYDKQSWNLEVFPLVTCELSESWSWDEIPAELVWAAKALGFTQASWDTTDVSMAPPSSRTTWGSLTEAERNAAGYLGYDLESWNQNCGA